MKHALLTVKEVCKLLRVHRPKVYDLLRAGEIEGFKLGSDWRIKLDSVEKLTGTIPDVFFEKRRIADLKEDHAKETEELSGLDIDKYPSSKETSSGSGKDCKCCA